MKREEFSAKVKDQAATRAAGHCDYDYVRSVLDYDPATGLMKWTTKVAMCIKSGDAAGGPHADGYTKISLRGKNYMAHRVAWLWVYGDWPSKQIDHINGIRTDNRIANLRLADHSQNAKNAGRNALGSSGLKGVSRAPSKAIRWRARIQVDKKQISLGCFATKAKAEKAYRVAAVLYFGEFARSA